MVITATPRIIRNFLLPSGFYLFCFVLMTYPAIRSIGSHIWCGPGDGLQMVWNIWWVDHAISQGQWNIWHTTWLHHPEGASLLVHTMHPLKGLMAMPLLRLFSLGTTYNLLVIFSFVMGGVTAFWLCRALTRTYVPSLIGGFVFSFCNFHFAHAQGHMQLISLEWIPLFILLWYRLLHRPSVRLALGCVGALALVILCDHYYFLYCVMAGGLMALWRLWDSRDMGLFVRPAFRLPLALFTGGALVTSGLLAVATVISMRHDPVGGRFMPEKFGMDALALLVPGGHWRFHEWTRGYWSRIPMNVHESSVHLGAGALVLAAIGLWRGRAAGMRDVGLWGLLFGFFFVMALGPRLTVAGWTAPLLGDPEVPFVRLPYTLLAKVVPGLQVGARPIRLIVMTILAASVLIAYALVYLRSRGGPARALGAGLLVLLAVEFLPSPLPMFERAMPAFVDRLAATEGGGSVYDEVTPVPRQMYYQTRHERPLGLGYISRERVSVRDRREDKEALYRSGALGELHQLYGYRFLVVSAALPVAPEAIAGHVIHEDADLRVYARAAE